MSATTPSNSAIQMPMERLARAIARHAPQDGDYPTAIPALSLHRRSDATQPIPCIFGFALAITFQGKKRVTLGDEIFDYSSGQSLLTTADLPVVARITQASITEPYLGLLLKLDQGLIAQIAAEMALPPPPKTSIYRAMSVIEMNLPALSAVSRLLAVLDEPSLVPHIAPHVQHEIAVRLLVGQHGPMLRQIVVAGTPSQQIARALSWLKQNFNQSLLVDELAESVHMSPSTFRHHFRAVAGMSPLQYQKQLRLQEARLLMLNEGLDVGGAAVRVGYESASQFSREYGRQFGLPPARDIHRVRSQT